MQELEFDGKKYRTGKLDAFKQYHLMRKLLPLFSGLGESFARQAPLMNGNGEVPQTNFWASLAPISQAISEMSMDDSEWILKTCLTAVSIHNGRSWAPLTTPNGQLMFEDTEMLTMVQLSLAVVQDNLGSFFPVPLLNASAPAETASPSPTSA